MIGGYFFNININLVRVEGYQWNIDEVPDTFLGGEIRERLCALSY